MQPLVREKPIDQYRANDLVDGIEWLIRMRWISVAIFLVAAPLLEGIAQLLPRLATLTQVNGTAFPISVQLVPDVPSLALVITAAIVAILNYGYQLILNRLRVLLQSQPRTVERLYLLGQAQIVADLFCLTVLTHLFGGWEGPLPFFMVFHMITAQSILSNKAAYSLAVLATLLLVGLGHLEYYDVLPHRPFFGFSFELHKSGVYLYSCFMALTAITLTSVFLMRRLSSLVEVEQERVKVQDVELASLYQSLQMFGPNTDLHRITSHVLMRYNDVYAFENYTLYLVDQKTGITSRVEEDGHRVPLENEHLPQQTKLIAGGRTVGPRYHVMLGMGKRVIGFLCVQKAVGESFGDTEISILQTVATNLAMVAINSELYRKLDRDATVDELTGLTNRRQFFNLLEQELLRSVRQRRGLAVALLGIDGFKSYNERFGQMVGDQLLRELSFLLRSLVRGSDIVARVGSDELGLVLPETNEPKGKVEDIGRRLRETIAEHCFSVALPEAARRVTVCVGVVVWKPERESDAREYRFNRHVTRQVVADASRILVGHADRALHQAKKTGGDLAICTVLKKVAAHL